MSIHNSLANEMLHDIVLGFEIKSLTRLTESNFVANKHSSYKKNITFLSINILRLIYKFQISTELTTIFYQKRLHERMQSIIVRAEIEKQDNKSKDNNAVCALGP